MISTMQLAELLRIDPYVDHLLTQIENVMFSDCGAPSEGISGLLSAWAYIVFTATTGDQGTFHFEFIELYISQTQYIVEVNRINYQNFEDTLGADGLQEYLNHRWDLFHQRYRQNLFKQMRSS